MVMLAIEVPATPVVARLDRFANVLWSRTLHKLRRVVVHLPLQRLGLKLLTVDYRGFGVAHFVAEFQVFEEAYNH